MNQGDFVYAWNYKQPDKKVRTRFLHRLDGINPSNVCVSPDTLDTYPKKVNLRRYDKVVLVDAPASASDPNHKGEDQESDTDGSILWAIVISVFIVSIAWIYYVVYDSRSDIQDITEKHYDLAGKVSGIEIKGDDTAHQLILSIENQYWYELNVAIGIAKSAGYNDYRKLVLINPSMNVVRLSDTEGNEISVNIESKVITIHNY